MPGVGVECLDIMISGIASQETTTLLCKTVYDVLTLSEGRSYTGINTRQCGLAFTANSDYQKDKLAQILTGL